MVLYFPIDKTEHYEPEIKWLYRSWIEMQKSEPLLWRTDLIIFIRNDPAYFNNPSFFLNQLNCEFTNRRDSKSDKPMCTLIAYESLSTRKVRTLKPDLEKNYEHFLANVNIFNGLSKDIEQFYAFCQKAFRDYRFADSIVVAFDGYEYFKVGYISTTFLFEKKGVPGRLTSEITGSLIIIKLLGSAVSTEKLNLWSNLTSFKTHWLCSF